ncbi:MAG: DHHW family protein [Oscillospiraceae bacterium]|nr:DHHW family protein [Oscillospiraceae bacterium]
MSQNHMEQEKRTARLARAKTAGCVLFIAALAAMGVLSAVLPKPTVSEEEKRELNKMPEFSWKALFGKEYTSQFDLFYADTFPFRDFFVKTGAYLEEARGFRADNVKIYEEPAVGPAPSEEPGVTGQEPSRPESSAPEQSGASSESVSSAPSGESSSSQAVSRPELPEGEGEKRGSLFIYNGMALPIFGGNEWEVQHYANVLNQYAEILGDEVQIYDLVIPSSIELLLPDKYKGISTPEKPNIDSIYSKLDSRIKTVNAYDALMSHRDEYIYFGTDHHWTGLGAYYAYCAMGEAAGFEPVKLEDCEKRTIEPFLGSLYTQSQDVELKNNPDHVDYYIMPGEYQGYLYQRGDPFTAYPCSPWAEYATGVNSYSVFLAGDQPLFEIRTGAGTGRKIMVFKESFGNAFSPWLINNFDTVYVADIRYFELNAIDFIREHGVTDVLFINNIFAANTNYQVSCIESLIYQQWPPAEPEPEESSGDGEDAPEEGPSEEEETEEE